jgi:hypothetical protein
MNSQNEMVNSNRLCGIKIITTPLVYCNRRNIDSGIDIILMWTKRTYTTIKWILIDPMLIHDDFFSNFAAENWNSKSCVDLIVDTGAQ